MTRSLQAPIVCVPLALSLMLIPMQADAQTVVVSGTVSAPAARVKNASVTFEENTQAGHSSTVLTDSTGHYRLVLTLASAGLSSTLPAAFALDQNYPNPFSSVTAISYELKSQVDTRVAIFDILGRVVQETVVGAQPAGAHSLLWDGRNASGRSVAPGVYFYSLQAGGEAQVKKMVLYGGSGGGASLPLRYAAPKEPVAGGTPKRGPGGNYTVRIENTGDTSPLIVARQFDNVVIQTDTTLDFVVERQVSIPVAKVFVDSLQQSIRGFGAANILPWRPDMTADQVQKAFGSGQGQLGFTMLRLRIPYSGSTADFAAQVPTAKLAQSLGAIVFASPWTPPPAMKSSNDIVGGMLNESSYAAYAAHLKSFADYMASNGAPLYAVSLQNEPDATVTYESCFWNATQFLNFLKQQGASIGTRVMMPEGQNFVHALSDSTLNDPTAAANVSIIAGHIYGGGLGPYPLAVNKGKELWMTEHLDLDTLWAGVLATGTEIHNCMLAGMHAYVWWYIVRFYGPIGEDGNVTKRGYVMSQFARFVRPGYHRVACHATPQRYVVLSAYKDPSTSRVVIVALNTGTSPLQQIFAMTGGGMTAFTAYTTSQTKNCADGGDIAVVNGAFSATLEPSSITTFVSK